MPALHFLFAPPLQIFAMHVFPVFALTEMVNTGDSFSVDIVVGGNAHGLFVGGSRRCNGLFAVPI